jgi:hypothetical protein
MELKTTAKPKKQSGAISPNAFAGRAEHPSNREVEAALGQSFGLWKQLVAELRDQVDLDKEDGHSSGVKYGWALRLQKKSRNILYLGPRLGSFVAAFVLGDKAVAKARKSELPAWVLKMIAKRYGVGTPVRIDVGKFEDLEAVKILARIKVGLTRAPVLSPEPSTCC